MNKNENEIDETIPKGKNMTFFLDDKTLCY